MAKTAFDHISILATMDGVNDCATADFGREITDGAIIIENGVIQAVGTHEELAAQIASCDDVISFDHHIVIPGMVNTHHHLFQNLTRLIPEAQNESLFGWLQTLYPIWQNLEPDDFYISTALGLAELALSGCTTSSDHQYIFPNGTELEQAISAAHDVGMRFTATRGSMSIGESNGGLPPDSLTEREDDIIKDSIRLVDSYHDDAPHAMLHISLAPCSPFSVSRELMRDSALLAKDKGVRLHTHLAENVEDIEYSLANFNLRPGDYAEELGWVGDHVWHAHCVQLNDDELDLFARTKTGIAHCPCSNMRLASGIAPVRKMRDKGVPVGLGVDGSSSSDSAHMINEARQTMLLQRVQGNPGAMSAREALFIATRGGADVLGRKDIGQIAPGFAADFAIFDKDVIDFAGTQTDPLAALVFCGPVKPRDVMINGKFVVRDGHLTTMPLATLLERHDKAASGLLRRAGHIA